MRRILTGLAACALGLACSSQASSPSPVGPFTVRGHVFDAVTKAPMPAVTISVKGGVDAAGIALGSTQTDAQGACVLPNRAPGSITVEVFVPGYNLILQTITLTNDATLDFPLTKPIYTLSGRVTDITTAMPLSGALLEALGATKNANRSTTTGPDGRYQMTSLFIEGFILRVRFPGYDSEFRGIGLSADTTLDIQMRPAMQSLSGTWTGTWNYTTGDAPPRTVTDQLPGMQLAQDGAALSVAVTVTPGPNSNVGAFDGTLRDPSAIGSTTQVTGTITLNYSAPGSGRGGAGGVFCVGTGAFSGTVNWTQLVITAPQVVFPCTSPYAGVTLSLVRQH
jgi:hypothetical protein